MRMFQGEPSQAALAKLCQHGTSGPKDVRIFFHRRMSA